MHEKRKSEYQKILERVRCEAMEFYVDNEPRCPQCESRLDKKGRCIAQCEKRGEI